MKFNTKFFLVGLIISVSSGYFIVGGFYDDDDNSLNTVEGLDSVIVEKGEIRESIEVVGAAELIDEQELKFNKESTVTDVYFKEGDSVFKGQTIAKLDDSDAYDDIENAKLSLENAEISLVQLYEDEDESKVMSSQNTITNSKASLDIAKKELENLQISQVSSLTEKQNNIDTSTKELSNLKESLVLAKKELNTYIKEKDDSLEGSEVSKYSKITDIEIDIKNYMSLVEEIIQEADYILGVTTENKDKNNDYDDYFGAMNSGVKNRAKLYLKEAIVLHSSLEELFENYNFDGDKEKITELLNEYLTLFEKLYDVADLIYESAENSIESISNLSESDLNSIKNNMSSYRSNSLSEINSIEGSFDDLTTLTDTSLVSESNENSIAGVNESIRDKELNIEKKELELQVEIDEYNQTVEEYKLAIESKQKDITTKDLALKVSETSLSELLEGPSNESIKKLENSIRQAEIKLDAAYENLEDYILTAPFDGLITKIDYMPGDNLSDDNDKYVYIENPNLLEVTVMLDQIDIINVEIGDSAIITFDTYSTSPIDAEISNIDTSPLKNSGVVSYEVKLVLVDESFDKKILSGMTADVEIINEYKEDILLLKTSAIKTEGDKKIVILDDNGTQKKVEITTGLSSDGMTEIVSGLSRGDIVIVGEFNISTEKEDADTTLFSTPTGGGGQGRRQ